MKTLSGRSLLIFAFVLSAKILLAQSTVTFQMSLVDEIKSGQFNAPTDRVEIRGVLDGGTTLRSVFQGSDTQDDQNYTTPYQIRDDNSHRRGKNHNQVQGIQHNAGSMNNNVTLGDQSNDNDQFQLSGTVETTQPTDQMNNNQMSVTGSMETAQQQQSSGLTGRIEGEQSSAFADGAFNNANHRISEIPASQSTEAEAPAQTANRRNLRAVNAANGKSSRLATREQNNASLTSERNTSPRRYRRANMSDNNGEITRHKNGQTPTDEFGNSDFNDRGTFEFVDGSKGHKRGETGTSTQIEPGAGTTPGGQNIVTSTGIVMTEGTIIDSVYNVTITFPSSMMGQDLNWRFAKIEGGVEYVENLEMPRIVTLTPGSRELNVSYFNTPAW